MYKGNLVYIDKSGHFAVIDKGPKIMSMTIDGEKGQDYDGIVIGSFVFSSDGSDSAYIAKRGAKQLVVVDGKEDPEFDEIFGPIPMIVFSADGQHYAYAAKKEGKAMTVFDGKEGPAFVGVRRPVISPDGKRVAYIAMISSSASDPKMEVVDDGKVSPVYNFVGAITYSPDSKRLAYIATQGKKSFMVVDGNIGQPYDGIAIFIPGAFIGPVFSSNSKHLAYQAHKGAKMVVVVDGKEGPEYDAIEERSPIFSPDGKHMAYVAQLGKKEFAVLDGVAGAEYDAVRQMVFSNDGQRFAYIAYKGQKNTAVIDGKEGPEYDEIGGITFSPDGQHVHYTAYKYKEQIYVVDDKGNMKYLVDAIASASYELSPDGRHVVVAEVSDGNEGPEHEPKHLQVFSPDWKHTAYVNAASSKEQFVIVDGQSCQKYFEIATTPKFLPDNSLEYLAIRDEALYRVIQPLPAGKP